MPPQLSVVVEHLRRAAGVPPATLSDAELLDRFVRHRDAAAFELLVRRHERLVLAVCRRVLGNRPDADDAFQSTFLVLVSKAGSIGKGQALAAWLGRVAFRVALHAHAARRRRQQREPTGLDGPEPAVADDPTTLRDWLPILDRELDRLPDQYRTPIVLCHLDGLTYAEAARQLGCSREAVWARLSRGRQPLRQRLVRRGVTLTAGALAALLARTSASSAAPTILE